MRQPQLAATFIYIKESIIDGVVTQAETKVIDRALEQGISNSRYYNSQTLGIQLVKRLKVLSFLVTPELRYMEVLGVRYKLIRAQKITTAYSSIELEDYN